MAALAHSFPKDTLVQPHRFEIVEDLGCQAAIFPSTLAIVLIWIPPLILCTVILVIIGGCTDISFWKFSC